MIIGLPRSARIFRLLFDNWPLVLVALGLIVLIGAFRKPAAPQPPPATGAGAVPPPAPPPATPEEPVEPKID